MINFSLNWWDYIALFSIVFIGIPHGALDGAIAFTLGYTKKLTQKLYFIIIYLFVSLVVIILWFFFPVITLTLFLLTSIFHFGCGDLDWKKDKLYFVGGYVHGGLIVLGIIFLNRVEVSYFFEILSGNELSMLWLCLHIAIFFWFSSIVFILLNYDKIKVSSYYIKLLMLISIIMIQLKVWLKEL